MVPFVPILQHGEDPYPTFAALEVRYRVWVLPRVMYDSIETLRDTFEDLILRRAQQKEEELRALRTAEPESIDARAYRMRQSAATPVPPDDPAR
jgi:hypothetical protein